MNHFDHGVGSTSAAPTEISINTNPIARLPIVYLLFTLDPYLFPAGLATDRMFITSSPLSPTLISAASFSSSV
jgi:hypothetical protein